MPESYELHPTTRTPSSEESQSYASHTHTLNMSRSSRSSLDSLAESDPLSPHASYKDKDIDSPATSLLAMFDSEKRSSYRTSRRSHRPIAFTRSCCLISTAVFFLLLILLSGGGYYTVTSLGIPPDGQSPPWYPSPRGGQDKDWSESYRKAAELVRQMTLVEKVNVTTGIGWMMGPCVGNTGPVPRLNFPSLCLQDGPLGLRFADHATAFPAGITVGATWNRTTMYERGKAHGLEAKSKGINVLLGPAMGPLGKLPAGGRNWEGFGSDPVLQGIGAAMTIRGIQDQGVIATAKHYVGNEQEHYRQSWEWGTPNAISSNIDDRALHEMYAWPFADSIKAGVGSVMCSYNMVNNSYACQNSKLLNGVLKDELGFQGFVQSDWLAQRGGVASSLAGLDMTMPGDGLTWMNGQSLWGRELTKSVLNGTMPVERLDDMVLRIVAAWYQMGQDDRDRWPYENGTIPNFSSWTNEEVGLLYPGSDDKSTGKVNWFVDERRDNWKVARQVATEGIVMVKNEEQILPLHRDGFAMTQTEGRKLKVGIFGEDAFANPAGPNACQDRACNDYTLASGWGSGAVEFPYLISPAFAITRAVVNGTVDFSEVPSNQLTSDLDKTAKSSDICLVFISSDAGEGFVSWKNVKGDRNDLYAQKGGDKLVKRVAAKCGNGGNGPVVVVLHTVGPTILEEWIEHPNVKAVLIAHLPGQESGHALADVLYGAVSPSGRLPYTIGKRASDYGPHSAILRSTKALVPQQNFTDGVFLDYRHFDAYGITPRYPFGYGLSYTSFHYSTLELHSLVPQRTPFPAARPDPAPVPPIDRRPPVAADAVLPAGFHRIGKYIYPYLDQESDAAPGTHRYPYPDGYTVTAPPSAAGGAQGGNPDLWTPLALVKAVVTNTGTSTAAAVVQCYLQFPPNITNSLGQKVHMPPRQLRGFEKVFLGLDEGEGEGKRSVKVQFELTRRDLSYWDIGVQNWVLPRGKFAVWVGENSREFKEGMAGFLPLPDYEERKEGDDREAEWWLEGGEEPQQELQEKQKDSDAS